MNEKIIKQLQTKLDKTTFDDETLTMKGIIGSDGSLDRHGERVNPYGWHLESYMQNPAVFFNHNSNTVGFAKTNSISLKDGNLIFDIQFNKRQPKSDINGEAMYYAFKEGFINALSVGFGVNKYGADGDEYDFMEQTLHEISAVAVPANQNATASRALYTSNKSLYTEIKAMGVELLQEEEEKQLDVIKAGKVLSAKNEASIREVKAILDSLLLSLEKEDEKCEVVETVKEEVLEIKQDEKHVIKELKADENNSATIKVEQQKSAIQLFSEMLNI